MSLVISRTGQHGQLTLRHRLGRRPARRPLVRARKYDQSGRRCSRWPFSIRYSSCTSGIGARTFTDHSTEMSRKEKAEKKRKIPKSTEEWLAEVEDNIQKAYDLVSLATLLGLGNALTPGTRCSDSRCTCQCSSTVHHSANLPYLPGLGLQSPPRCEGRPSIPGRHS